MLRNNIICVLSILLFSGLTHANPTPEEIFGNLPAMRAFSISPDGEHYAYIQRANGNDYFIIYRSETGELIASVAADSFKARSTYFATNHHVVLKGSQTSKVFGYRGRFENTGALVFNITTGKVKLLLKGTEDLHQAQGGLGKIVGLNRSAAKVYMPAYHDSNRNPAYNLYRVNLDTGRGKLHARGNSSTRDWFVDKQGRILAREEYDNEEQEHRILSKVSGKWQAIYSKKVPFPDISVAAISADSQSLLFIGDTENNHAVYAINLETGKISEPLYAKADKDVDHLVTDINRHLVAVAYGGFKLAYDFVDEELDTLFENLGEYYSLNSVSYRSSTENNKKIVLKVSGNDAPGSYILFDTEKRKLSKLASEYDISSIGQLKPIRYKARDGLSIPAIVTFPTGDAGQKNLPLIALPHGGPESHDGISFDWLAQYFAAKGYLVLQPNFRGSDGFGDQFLQAGRGRWGREMQDDISDGIKLLVEAGHADPERVCIIGASYGGYSALAGGAFSPELYRCIVSINGVSDIPMMMRDNRYRYKGDHWVVSYWETVLGGKEKDLLKEISPINFANNFNAPVLLIHGEDDTVVPISQSQQMFKALDKEGKKVSMVKLEDEDHWLSVSSSRLKTLKAMNQFLIKYNPAHLSDQVKVSNN